MGLFSIRATTRELLPTKCNLILSIFRRNKGPTAILPCSLKYDAVLEMTAWLSSEFQESVAGGKLLVRAWPRPFGLGVRLTDRFRFGSSVYDTNSVLYK